MPARCPVRASARPTGPGRPIKIGKITDVAATDTGSPGKTTVGTERWLGGRPSAQPSKFANLRTCVRTLGIAAPAGTQPWRLKADDP